MDKGEKKNNLSRWDQAHPREYIIDRDFQVDVSHVGPLGQSCPILQNTLYQIQHYNIHVKYL